MFETGNVRSLTLSRSPCIDHLVSSLRITSGLAFLNPGFQTVTGRALATLFFGPLRPQSIGHRAATLWSGDWLSGCRSRMRPLSRVHPDVQSHYIGSSCRCCIYQLHSSHIKSIPCSLELEVWVFFTEPRLSHLMMVFCCSPPCCPIRLSQTAKPHKNVQKCPKLWTSHCGEQR